MILFLITNMSYWSLPPSKAKSIRKITHYILALVILKKNEALNHPTTIYEVEETIFGIPKNKALGHDGFTSNFFQA